MCVYVPILLEKQLTASLAQVVVLSASGPFPTLILPDKWKSTKSFHDGAALLFPIDSTDFMSATLEFVGKKEKYMYEITQNPEKAGNGFCRLYFKDLLQNKKDVAKTSLKYLKPGKHAGKRLV